MMWSDYLQSRIRDERLSSEPNRIGSNSIQSGPHSEGEVKLLSFYSNAGQFRVVLNEGILVSCYFPVLIRRTAQPGQI